MKKTFITQVPDKSGAFLKASRIIAEAGGNITRVSYNKAIDLHNGIYGHLITDSPYFFIALVAMVLGSQLFLAGFLGDLISRQNPNRNDYQIEKEIRCGK